MLQRPRSTTPRHISPRSHGDEFEHILPTFYELPKFNFDADALIFVIFKKCSVL